MTVEVDSRADLDLETLRRVALEGEGVRLSDGAWGRVAAAHDSFQVFVAEHQDSFIYMVTAGAGPDAARRYSLDQARERRRRMRPFLGLSFGGGELPEYVSRATMFASIAALLAGTSATHPERVRAIVESLDGPLPRLPARGLVAAGELMPRFVLRPDKDLEIADEGFSAGTRNGAPAASAMAGLTAIFARRRLQVSEAVLALSVEGCRASLDAYHPALKELWGDPHDAAALDRLGALLDGADPERHPGLAPLSYRALPRLLGQSRRALVSLEDVATTGLREAGNNPSYIWDGPYEAATVSTGAYHNADAAPAIDAVGASWVDLAAVAHRHTVKLHKGGVSGLPDRLLPPGTDYTSAFSTTYLEYTPNQALSEMRRLARSTLLSPAEVAASEQDDLAITAPIAFVAEREVGARLDEVLAVLAVAASQALHVGGTKVAPALEGLLDLVRSVVPPVESRRQLGEECGRLAATISAAVEAGGDELEALAAPS